MNYKIREIEWDKKEQIISEQNKNGYIRFYSKNKLIYCYEIFQYYLGEGNWSKWHVQISLKTFKYFDSKTDKIIYNVESLEEAMSIANNHNRDFIKQYLDEV